MASYFATRLAPLVEENGGRARKASDSDARLVTFFNKELKQTYVDLVLQIRASNAMAQFSVETVFALDGGVDAAAASTDESRTRYETAVEKTCALYPLVVQGGNLVGCELPTYGAFRRWLRVFLSVYKEFFLQGEVLCERVVPGRDVGPYAAVREDGFGYRVRGALQRTTNERRYAFWGKELLARTVSGTELKRRVQNSKRHRAELEARQVEQQRARAQVTVAARAAKTARKTAQRAASQQLKEKAEKEKERRKAEAKAGARRKTKATAKGVAGKGGTASAAAGGRKRKRAGRAKAGEAKGQGRGNVAPAPAGAKAGGGGGGGRGPAGPRRVERGQRVRRRHGNGRHRNGRHGRHGRRGGGARAGRFGFRGSGPRGGGSAAGSQCRLRLHPVDGATVGAQLPLHRDDEGGRQATGEKHEART